MRWPGHASGYFTREHSTMHVFTVDTSMHTPSAGWLGKNFWTNQLRKAGRGLGTRLGYSLSWWCNFESDHKRKKDILIHLPAINMWCKVAIQSDLQKLQHSLLCLVIILSPLIVTNLLGYLIQWKSVYHMVLLMVRWDDLVKIHSSHNSMYFLQAFGYHTWLIHRSEVYVTSTVINIPFLRFMCHGMHGSGKNHSMHELWNS